MRFVAAITLALIVASPAAWAGSARVTIKDYMFQPSTLTITAGTKVVWTNQDQVAHTVKSSDAMAPFASAPLEAGQRFSYTFAKPGTYHVICAIHPYMKETITVR